MIFLLQNSKYFTLSAVTSMCVISDVVLPIFCQAFLVTSFLSIRYSMMIDPPFDSGSCHFIVTDVSVIPEISSGPRGGDGGSKNFMPLISVVVLYLFALTILTFDDNCATLKSVGCADWIGGCDSEHVFRAFAQLLNGVGVNVTLYVGNLHPHHLLYVAFLNHILGDFETSVVCGWFPFDGDGFFLDFLDLEWAFRFARLV